jgi:hypothetical protein
MAPIPTSGYGLSQTVNERWCSWCIPECIRNQYPNVLAVHKSTRKESV